MYLRSGNLLKYLLVCLNSSLNCSSVEISSMFITHPILLLCSCLSSVHAIWPAPQQYHHGSSVVWLSSEPRLVYEPLKTPLQPLQWIWDYLRKYTGSAWVHSEGPCTDTLSIGRFLKPSTVSWSRARVLESAQVSAETLLREAFARMTYNIRHENFVPRKFHSRNSDFEPQRNNTNYRMVETITIKEVTHLRSRCVGCDVNLEAYTLNMDQDGRAVIEIVSPQGGLYAIQTFSQLFFAHSEPSFGFYSPYAPLSILDSPDFEHRGLNLDIARNWISPQDVMRTIEAMAATKLNQLHLHAADAQSWPIEISAHPALAMNGAYDQDQSWSPAELEAVQRHGSAHGVEVFLEIDLPGHTRAVGYAYPDLVVAADREPWSEFALEPPAGQLSLNSSDVNHFLTTLLDDLLPRTSRWSSKFHIGGDELNTHLYDFDPTVRSSSSKVLQPLVQAFVDNIISVTQSYGIRPIVWEEMLLEWNLTLPKSATIQTWRSNSALNAVVSKGHRALFGSNDHWYLDCGLGWFLDPSLHNPDLSDPDRRVRPPYLDSCSPFKNWRHIYSYNPLEGVSQEHWHLIAGGEVHMWGELTDSITLDSTLWPRVAAAAEVMWSGAGKMADESTTRRLAEFRERLVARGVRAGMVQMEWCLRNQGKCTL